jgi:hypothetical protein
MAGENVALPIPAGMTAEDVKKAYASFLKSRVATQERDKAVRAATKDLIAAHKEQYDGLVKKYSPK